MKFKLGSLFTVAHLPNRFWILMSFIEQLSVDSEIIIRYSFYDFVTMKTYSYPESSVLHFIEIGTMVYES